MNQEESEHNEVDGMKKGVDSKGEVMHIVKFIFHVALLRFRTMARCDIGYM